MFLTALSNVLLTLCYIIPGYALCKSKKSSADHLSTVSSYLVYVCSPCMVISSLIDIKFDRTQLLNTALFILITLVLQIAFMLIIYLIFRKKFTDSKYRMLTIASVMGNVGFFGLPLVKALLPDNPEVMCYSAAASVALNMLTFTVGVFCITGDKKYMKLSKALLNPNSIGFAVGLILSLIGIKKFTPQIILNAVNLLGSMTTPVCMLILGVRLATVRFNKLFKRPFVYLSCLTKLIIFPLFCYFAVYFLPLPFSFKASMLILSATPCASMILNLAEIHHKETELSANTVLLSTLVCFMTIPLLMLLVQ